MQILVSRVCGIDVHKDMLAKQAPAGRPETMLAVAFWFIGRVRSRKLAIGSSPRIRRR
jgi:hypothetical protein